MSLPGNAELKAELRARARSISSVHRAGAAELALRSLGALPELLRARTVALYSAIGDEVPVDAAAAPIRARGGRVVYPIRTATTLELAIVDDAAGLRPGRGGIGEPGLEAQRVAVGEVDTFVVPGLLFDRDGRRLGRGGGHYDRLLRGASADAASIGICYADRVVDELPQDAWDVAMDVVVTESFVVRRANGHS